MKKPWVSIIVSSNLKNICRECSITVMTLHLSNGVSIQDRLEWAKVLEGDETQGLCEIWMRSMPGEGQEQAMDFNSWSGRG